MRIKEIDELGQKTISLYIDDNGCKTDTIEKSIMHNPIPTPTFEAAEKICFNSK